MINTQNSGIGGVLHQGLNGLQNSHQSIVESANELVRSGTVERIVATTDIVEPIINIQQQQHIFDASAKIVKTADEALGALIDTKA